MLVGWMGGGKGRRGRDEGELTIVDVRIFVFPDCFLFGCEE